MPMGSVNGVAIHYEVFGAGKDVVLCHGFSGSHQDWIYLIAALAPDYRVLVMDHRGHGSSQAPASPEAYSIMNFAQDVRSLLELVGVGRCCLVGHSMGGFIALELTLSCPELVAALVLVDTSSGQIDSPPEHTEVRLKAMEMARTEGLEAAFEYSAANSPITREHFRRHPRMREISRRATLETSVDGYVYASQAIRRWPPVASRLSQIKVPTLIIVGEEDTLFLGPIRALNEGIPDSRMVVVAGAGHTPQVEQPEAVNRALRDFLADIAY